MIRAVGKVFIAIIDIVIVVLTTKGQFLVSIGYYTTSTLSIAKALTRSISITSTSTNTIYFGYFRTLTASAVTSIASVLKQVGKIVAASVSSSVTLVKGPVYPKLLTVSSTVTLSIVKSVQVVRLIAVSASLTFTKLVNLNQSVVSTVVNTLVTAATIYKTLSVTVAKTVALYVYKIRFNTKDIIYVTARKVKLAVVTFVTVVVSAKKTTVAASKQDNLNV
jgi:hypothetical protein